MYVAIPSSIKELFSVLGLHNISLVGCLARLKFIERVWGCERERYFSALPVRSSQITAKKYLSLSLYLVKSVQPKHPNAWVVFIAEFPLNIIQSLKENISKGKLLATKDLNKIFIHGSHAYKVYTIPKRKAGSRTIAHPSKKLKVCQRELTSVLRLMLPVHSASYAYVAGRGIKDNAIVHANSSFLLKMDFQNFFNSITPDILSSHFAKLGIEISESDLNLLNQVVFWNPSKKSYGKLILSVGAPISPFISNTIMFNFDKTINEACSLLGVNYTRYADDLTFSTNTKDLLFKIPEFVKYVLSSEFGNRILINDSKTVFSSKKHNRHITGVTINNEGKLSLGRARKRYISSLIFKYLNKKLPSEDLGYLYGLISFSYNIEPDFLYRMSAKYKVDLIKELLHRGS